MAAALTALIMPVLIADPFFGGDEAHRMHLAQYPAIRLDNRVWLPVLQLHIWAIYQFQPPLYVFKLVSCFYYFAAIFLVGVLAFNQTGRSRSGLVFSLALAFCFARQQMIMSLGMSLMQEIIGVALFLLLLQSGALELRKKWWLLLTVVLALLTRDDFWIYLFVVSLLNWRKILSDRSYIYAFFALWSVPALWSLMIPFGYWFVDGRFPDFPAEWPLGINKDANQGVSDLHASLASLWLSLTRTGVLYFIAGLVVLWGVLQVYRPRMERHSFPAGRLAAVFKPFSLASLGVIYALIFLFDPWEATPGAGRMSFPLLIHAFVWAIVLFAEACASHRVMKYVAVLLIFPGLAMSLNLDPLNVHARDYDQIKAVYQEVERDLDLLVPVKQDLVCISDKNYFSALRSLLPPLLYRKRLMLAQEVNPNPDDCAVIFISAGSAQAAGAGFRAYKDYLIDDYAWTLFVR
jgi:hypothetical protein